MNQERLADLLNEVADGRLSIDEAQRQLAELPYSDLGFARLDLHREIRTGLPEAVFAPGKTDAQLCAIGARLLEAHGRLLISRVDPERVSRLASAWPEARFDEESHILTVGEPHAETGDSVAVVTAGTSDRPVASEAAQCLEWFGHNVLRLDDVGVAGLHRLLDNLSSLREADVVIAVAGMDGAMPSVLGNLIAAPVIAVPTSVGYGSSFDGLAALLTMLNACSSGIGVVNIDNGFGAAVLASRILGSGAFQRD